MNRIPHHKVRAMRAITELMLREMQDHPHAIRLRVEADRLYKGAAALDNVAANKDPTDTLDGHSLKVARLAKQFDRKITESINRASDILRDGFRDIEARINAKVDLRPNAFAEEVRAVFRALKPGEKAEMIERLVDANDGPELAAIVKAPAVLTGIKEEQRAIYEKMVLDRHAAAELEERSNLERVHHAFMRVEAIASRLVTELIDPRGVAEIQKRQAQAREATDKFENSME